MPCKLPPRLVVPGTRASVTGEAVARGPGLEPTPGLDGASLLVRAADTPTPRGLVILLHGAGSGTDTPVLRALAARLTAAGVDVARLDMPYRVAAKRPPDRAARLDAVLLAAVATPAASTRPLAFAGVSMGSRVACRCARAAGAVGVLAVGFPLQPPNGRPSRAAELAGAGVEVLVVQGERDAFGMPEPDPSLGRGVHVVAGADHSFGVRRKDGRGAGEVVAEVAGVGAGWLVEHLSRP
jgi:hypothetical protein